MENMGFLYTVKTYRVNWRICMVQWVPSCVGNLPIRVRAPLRLDRFFWTCDHTASVELEVGGLEKHIGSFCSAAIALLILVPRGWRGGWALITYVCC